MALSVAAGVPGNVSIASSASVNSLRKLSHLSSLQFPTQLRSFTIRNQRLKSKPTPHLVEAKQQTSSSFDDVLENSDKPVLVDFFATWCGPCQFMVPILEQVSDLMKDKIHIVKIDTEKNQSIADKYKIEALPTFILFKDGKPCDRFEGAMGAENLIQRIETSLRVEH
ncbi:Thioredoxin Y1 [Abeliophyllum distichum]|uniref:Thioredoxin Y1 n=1 Tax=Abeliophyllum distichum TaxID=126358 RepID=A0ABD1Q685_9LAMI